MAVDKNSDQVKYTRDDLEPMTDESLEHDEVSRSRRRLLMAGIAALPIVLTLSAGLNRTHGTGGGFTGDDEGDKNTVFDEYDGGGVFGKDKDKDRMGGGNKDDSGFEGWFRHDKSDSAKTGHARRRARDHSFTSPTNQPR